MARLEIGLLTDMCGPLFGGGYQSSLWEMARRLARDHEVRVYTSQEEPESRKEGVSFIRNLPLGIYPDLSGTRGSLQPALLPAFLVRDPLRGWRPDILIVEAMPFTQLPVLTRWARLLSSLKVLRVDEAWVGYSPWRGDLAPLGRQLSRWLLSQGVAWADTTLAVSPATASALRGFYRAKDVFFLPSGLDLPRLRSCFPPSSTPRDIDVVSVGRLVRMKRHGEIIEALARLKRRTGWSGRACILGDGPLLPELRRRVRSLGLGHQVELPGQVDEAQKMQTLSRSKVFVLASEREGFSLATLESMVAGCVPIVAVPPDPEVFGVAGLVEEGRTGVHYPLGDIEALERRISALLLDEERRHALSVQARAQGPFYDWDELMKRFESELSARVEARASPAD